MNLSMKTVLANTTFKTQDCLYITMLYKRMLKEYDLNLYSHSRRVSQYAYTISKLICLSEEQAVEIAIGAMLHDIGKLEISRMILNKSDKLTAVEWDTMKSHPNKGFKMLLPFRHLFSETIFDIILYHHVRLDNRGYPSNVPKEKVSKAVRIVSIADSFDAMTCTRSYSIAKEKNVAISELINHSNTQFDEDLVKIFVDFLQSGKSLFSLPNALN